MPPFNQPCMKSEYKKKKCAQQNKPYTLRAQNTSAQKAHSSWAPPEVWNEHVRAQTHRLEQPPPPACHFPASWTTTKHLIVASLHTPHPLRQLEKSQPARFIRVCLLCFRFLPQTWTSSWHCPAQNASWLLTSAPSRIKVKCFSLALMAFQSSPTCYSSLISFYYKNAPCILATLFLIPKPSEPWSTELGPTTWAAFSYLWMPDCFPRPSVPWLPHPKILPSSEAPVHSAHRTPRHRYVYALSLPDSYTGTSNRVMP